MSRLAELETLVRDLAGMNPIVQGTCIFCSSDEDPHNPDCLWLTATELAEEQ